jgi:hypothetical protein
LSPYPMPACFSTYAVLGSGSWEYDSVPDKPFKKFEREVAVLIGGTRYPANSGAAIDCEGPTMLAQCKLVKRLSLEELTALAEVADQQGVERSKVGLVAVKVRRGKGLPSPGLVVMTFEQFRHVLCLLVVLQKSVDGEAARQGEDSR